MSYSGKSYGLRSNREEKIIKHFFKRERELRDGVRRVIISQREL